MPFRLDRETSVVPAIYALHLTELIAHWNISATKFLQDTGLGVAELSLPHSRLSVAMVERLVERARTLTEEPGLGFYFGLRMRISWHGFLGLAAMSAQNIRQALELVVRFVPTRTDALTFGFESSDKGSSLLIREHADFGAARDAVIFAIFVGIWQLARTLTGREFRGGADIAMPEPSYMGRFKSMLPGIVRFNQPETRLLFETEALAWPMIAADPATFLLTREQCERELAALGLAGPFTDRVRVLLLRSDGGIRSLEEIAARLYLGPRTLKRKLAELNVSYSALLDEERRRRSLLLLRDTVIPMEQIAEQLGYSDMPSFFRAFRRWTGRTPGAVRQSSGQRRHLSTQRKVAK